MSALRSRQRLAQVSNMSVLLLALSGPLQSWGDSSRFTVRNTGREPSKSGVLGLVASALGRSREASLEDLCSLEFGVRVDQPGEMIRDFQTEHLAPGGDSLPLSNRYYLADAKFLVALGGDSALLAEIERALLHPKWPLFLGRRSCPPDAPLLHHAKKGPYDDIRIALKTEPWAASEWYRNRLSSRQNGAYPDLEIVCDARDDEKGEIHADVPLSFGTIRRYGQRPVVREWINNPSAPENGGQDLDAQLSAALQGHDPMEFI